MFVSSMESVESQTPLTLSPSNSGRRISTDPNSPEFEFWMVRNPSFPTPNLLSADQLFNNGVLLPLQLLSLQQPDPPDLTPDPEQPEPAPESVPEPDSVSGVSTSKRWRDIFKMGEKKASEDKEKTKKKDRKSIGGAGGGGGGSGGAELNINIWPFSRSHSAGVGGTRPKVGGGGSRKVSSAPCSRSNSAGESKSRKWPNSPGRGGIHLGRNSPVWQVRRAGSGLKVSESVSVKSLDKVVKKEGTETRKVKTSTTSRCGSAAVGGGGGGGKGKGLSLNVPMCIGYRQQLSCRSDESSLVGGNGGGENGSGGTVNGSGGTVNGSGGAGKLFNLRTLFTTKKVY